MVQTLGQHSTNTQTESLCCQHINIEHLTLSHIGTLCHETDLVVGGCRLNRRGLLGTWRRILPGHLQTGAPALPLGGKTAVSSRTPLATVTAEHGTDAAAHTEQQ